MVNDKRAECVKRRWIVIIVVIIVTCIWLQSAISESKSAYESKWFLMNIVNPFLQRFGMEALDKNLVRKIAHVFEYLVLGVFVSLLWKEKLIKSINTGFIVAFLDESIQVFTGRGALITDVWIDMIGVTVGAIIGWLCYKNKHRKEC